jgi:hypothetical protein
MWGVTPELAEAAWPEGLELLAIDRAELMIHAVWPGDVPGRRCAIRGEWADTAALTGGELDAIVGDGSLINAAYPGEFRHLLAAARDSLRSGGIVVMRLHAYPDFRETVEDVLADLRGGRIGNFHVFKFRLAMTCRTSPEAGVVIGDIWELWNSLGLSPGELAVNTGWPLPVIRTIDVYRGKQGRYFFPTLEEHLVLFRDYFEVMDVRVPGYEMGERRPMVIMCRE